MSPPRSRSIALRILKPIALVVVALACGCGSSLPAPPTSPQPKTAFAEVPYPPPAANVETIPARPTPSSVWVDGSWLWQGRRWVWRPGGWVETPPGATYARWEARLEDDGKLVFAPAAWRDAAGKDIDAPKVLAPSHASTSTGASNPGLKPEETQGTGAFENKNAGDNGGTKK